MSYIPHRDNKDIDGKVSVKTLDALDKLVDKIDKSSIPGQHRDACGCSDPQCRTLQNIRLCSGATLPEALAWLYVKGMLTLPGTEATRDEVGQIVDEFGCTPSAWATEQAVEKLFEFYRIYPREPVAVPADISPAETGRSIDAAPKDWKPETGDLVTGEFRFLGGSTPVGKYSGQIQNTARIEVPPSDGGEPTICFVDADTLRPADLGPDLVAEAGLSPVDEATRTKVFAEFDAADPNAMTHRSRTHDVRATQWNKHGDHPSVFKNDCQPTPHDENLMCCDKPGTDHGWIRATDEDVCPGNWIVTDTDGTIDVFNAETFVSVYEPIKKTIAADGAR